MNYVHSDGKAILCMFNYGEYDVNRPGPHGMFWSDVMAASCEEVVPRSGGSMATIETVWRLIIANDEAKTLIHEIQTSRPQAGQNPVDLFPGDDHFFALLATNNGKGVARMLTAYPRYFGYKVISGARVFQGNHIYWMLKASERIPEPPPPPSALD